MLPELLLIVTLGLSPDPIAGALERFEQIGAYRLVLRSQGRRGEEVIRYAYRRPGFIRMDLVSPYPGAVLIYSPETRRVRLWPFGSPERRAGLSLSPLNPLVRSARGHRVDQSDVGTLLRNVQRLHRRGTLRLLGEAPIDGRRSYHLVVQGDEGHRVGEVAGYELWLDAETLFPRRVISTDRRGGLLERVQLEQIVIDPALPADFFTP